MAKKTKRKKSKPMSDIDLCILLKNRDDQNINKLIQFFKDLKKAYMCALNDKARLADKLDRLTVKFNKIQTKLSEVWVKDSLRQKTSKESKIG